MEYISKTGNRCRVIREERKTKNKKDYYILCEITHGITMEKGKQFWTNPTSFKIDWEPIK